MTKPKIPLQLYDVFMLNWPNRPRGLTKRIFGKPNRSSGSTKQKIPLQLYAVLDAKPTLQTIKPLKPLELYAQIVFGPFQLFYATLQTTRKVCKNTPPPGKAQSIKSKKKSCPRRCKSSIRSSCMLKTPRGQAAFHENKHLAAEG